MHLHGDCNGHAAGDDDNDCSDAAADGHRVSICFSCSALALLALLCLLWPVPTRPDHAFAHNHGECDGHLLLKLFTPHCNLILLKLQLLILRRRWMGTSAVFAVVHCVAVCAQNAEAWKLS